MYHRRDGNKNTKQELVGDTIPLIHTQAYVTEHDKVENKQVVICLGCRVNIGTVRRQHSRSAFILLSALKTVFLYISRMCLHECTELVICSSSFLSAVALSGGHPFNTGPLVPTHKRTYTQTCKDTSQLSTFTSIHHTEPT